MKIFNKEFNFSNEARKNPRIEFGVPIRGEIYVMDVGFFGSSRLELASKEMIGIASVQGDGFAAEFIEVGKKGIDDVLGTGSFLKIFKDRVPTIDKVSSLYQYLGEACEEYWKIGGDR